MGKIDRKILLVSAKKHMGAVVKYLKKVNDDECFLYLIDLAEELKEFIEDAIDTED